MATEIHRRRPAGDHRGAGWPSRSRRNATLHRAAAPRAAGGVPVPCCWWRPPVPTAPATSRRRAPGGLRARPRRPHGRGPGAPRNGCRMLAQRPENPHVG
ncbi:hypothetical protein HBB16_05785 [Pseudonocardia sp. MCCB 268]|nr:hypothetical protein [Pseudonocardia cytotoxica]